MWILQKKNFFLNFVCVGRVPDPTSHFLPTSFLYVNLVAMGPVHLSPVTWPQALRYWYSLTPLMHIVPQLRPIGLHNFLGQIPESSQFLGASKLPLLELTSDAYLLSFDLPPNESLCKLP
jgi:hypothetical protein